MLQQAWWRPEDRLSSAKKRRAALLTVCFGNRWCPGQPQELPVEHGDRLELLAERDDRHVVPDVAVAGWQTTQGAAQLAAPSACSSTPPCTTTPCTTPTSPCARTRAFVGAAAWSSWTRKAPRPGLRRWRWQERQRWQEHQLRRALGASGADDGDLMVT